MNESLPTKYSDDYVKHPPKNIRPTHSYYLRQRTPTPMVQQMFQTSILHIYDDNGNKLSLDALLKGPNKHIWERGLSNEIG